MPSRLLSRYPAWIVLVKLILVACVASVPKRETKPPGQTATIAPATTSPQPTQTAPPVNLAATASSGIKVTDVHLGDASLGVFERFEATFALTSTVATNLDWPYDPNPPPGLPAATGITVDGLFSSDDWTTVYTQPAFLYQPYTYTIQDRKDHLYPDGDPLWMVRFAPPHRGEWRFRIRATDASGTVIHPEDDDLAFDVISSANPGFLHVSATDPRYFEFDDGTLFVGVGHAEGFDSDRPIQDAREKFEHFEKNKANFFRVWMTGDSIFGSSWWPWTSHHLDYDGYLPATSLSEEQAYDGSDVSMKLSESNPCMFQGYVRPVPVLPDRRYEVRVRIKLQNVTGPAESGAAHGFIVKTGSWLGKDCEAPDVATPVTDAVTSTGDTWKVITGSLETGPDQYFLGNLYVSLSNVTGGAAYIDEVSVREQLGGGRYGPNVVAKPRMNAHTYFDPYPAWAWDRILDEAATHHVYLKLVILEKNEWIFNRITPEGEMTAEPSNDNFYAAPDTKVRWLHEAWWRYLTARWGYSTAVHSWELLNEGDPFNGNHHNQAEAFARYVHSQDPNQHMVTTSNWANFPVAEFWANPAHSTVDYADLHAYVSTGWGEYPVWGNDAPEPLSFEDDPARIRGESGHSLRVPGEETFHNATIPPGRLAIRGEGEWLIRFWMMSDGFTGTCPYGDPATLAGPRLIWELDGGKGNVVPPAEDAQDFVCSAPAGTYDWTPFDSAHTAEGNAAKASARVLIEDDQTHNLYVAVQNAFGNGGTAWIDDIEIVSPDGTILATNGAVALDSMQTDAALYTAAYGRIYGGQSPAGAHKPLVRGEAGLDHPGGPQLELDDLALDSEGIWLHNLVWGGINAGGMYDLYWWTENIRQYDLYHHYRSYRHFLEGIPLNNGRYRAAEAQSSDPNVRVWGQIDPVTGWGHLWIQNRHHTWWKVVNQESIPALFGTVTIDDLPPASYEVTWWDTYAGEPEKVETVSGATGTLTLSVPDDLSTDIAVKFKPLVNVGPQAHPPVVLRAE